MISSVFDKTNPIIFFSVLLIFSIHYWYWLWTGGDLSFDLGIVGGFFAKLLIIVFSIFLVEFMVKKNQISSKNTYAILVFVLLFGIFAPDIYESSSLLALFFVLLALRRILSMRSLISIRLKIFDAGFWILVASYFNAYALYFFLILFLAIYFYQSDKLKNWFVLLVALGAYFLLVVAYMGIDEFVLFYRSHYKLGFDFGSLVALDASVMKLLLFLFLGLLASIATYRGLSLSLMGRLISIRLVLISFIVGSVIALGNSSDAQQLVFLLFPASVLMANALESIKRSWIKDLIFLILLGLPFVLGTL